MEFKPENREHGNWVDEMLKTDPQENVVPKEEFEKRIEKVFTILWERLSVTFGPGGSGSFVSVYPGYFNTKDGFSVMKNIGWSQKIDQVISDMVMNICSRLNFTVGDGTTTAVIATKSVYDSYRKSIDTFKDKHILPRTILKEFENIKNEVLDAIDNEAMPIRSDDPEELRANISKVVDISSNNNELITKMISDMYAELKYPAITCVTANDGVTKSKIIEGYKINTSLTDKLYINNDNNTMVINHADFIIFDHKVTQDTYLYILKPLMQLCQSYGRHIVCIAPYYDEVAMQGIIRKDLNELHRKWKDIPLVLAVCSNTSAAAKRNLDDLSMLLNTSIITHPMAQTMIAKQQKDSNNTYPVFNIDCRDIPGIIVGVVDKTKSSTDNVVLTIKYSNELDDSDEIYNARFEDTFRIGHCETATLGLSESTFSGFYYDEDLYKKYLSVAKDELNDIQNKCKNIGTYSPQLIDAQKRLYALSLKTGVIEVGSTSEISQGYLRDTFDDAIKAAASAFKNGVVLGCNVTTLSILEKMRTFDGSLKDTLIALLYNGFKKVYDTVLGSIFENCNVNSLMDVHNQLKDYGYTNTNLFELDCIKHEHDSEWRERVDKYLISTTEDKERNLFNVIEYISIKYGKVFNLTTGQFDDNVVNSAETDKEIVKAIIDLLGLLITGNQLVLR